MMATSTAAYPLVLSSVAGDDFTSKLKSRDEGAFRLLYDDYSSALFTRIVQSTKERESAEDILQNVFVKIWLNIGTYDHEKGSLYTWMLNICRNETVDFYRRKQSKKRQIDEWYAKALYPRVTEVNNNKIDAGRFMESLSAKDRVIIDLIYFRGFTYQQAATILQIAAGTLKTRVRTLLKNWRKDLVTETS